MKATTASDWRATLRARRPSVEGYIERDDVRVFYELYGSGEPTILLLPTWSVLHAAHGRFQIADLSRHYRVVTFDGRGSGRSDRPGGAAAYDHREFVADALAVLDATETERVVAIACSEGTKWLVRLAAEHPDRILAAIASGTNLPLGPGHPRPADMVPFHERYQSTEGWAKFNADYWREHYEEFLRFFFAQVWTEPHSDKLIGDCVGWGLETTAQTLIDTVDATPMAEAEATELARRIRCPMLVIHGGAHAVTPLARGIRLVDETNGRLVILEGAGHCSGNRDPVRFNLLVREFVQSLGPRPGTAHWARAQARPRRVMFVPSGADLRIVRRDMDIAAGLRELRPGVEIHWLAASPVREVLEEHGETVHPASDELVSEASHVAHEPDQPESHPFEAWRRLDEVHFRNFMVFNDVSAQEPIDLVIADGAWQIDHYLHENPELKRFAYAWLTDTAGWLPDLEGDKREASLAADANAEMLEQVERYPRLRDRAVYLGDAADLSPDRFGRASPPIRNWTKRHFTFTGPVAESLGAREVASTLAALL